METGCTFVVIAVDWVTRWAEAEAEATLDATPETAAEFLYNRIICRVECVIGTLKAMLKRTVAAVSMVPSSGTKLDDVQIYGVDLSLDQSLIDAIALAQQRRDAALSEVDEAALASDYSSVYWTPLLHTVLWVYRATPHSVTGLSPALLALGKELRLPIDIRRQSFETDNEVAPFTNTIHKACITKRLQWITDAIPGLKELQTPQQPSSVPKFYLGQKVWKRESKYDGKGFVPVFAPRLTSPFVVHSVFDKNVYKLRTIPEEGKELDIYVTPSTV